MRVIKNSTSGLLVIAISLGVAVSFTGCAAKPKDVLTNPPIFGRSADDLHTAWVQVTDQGKLVAVVDGRLDKMEYDQVTAIIFSPDGHRVAYPAKDGPKWRLVADGRALESEWDEINPSCVVFSPDGSRLAYGARQSQKWYIVLGGEVDQTSGYDSLAFFTFSPDSRHLACVAGKDSRQAVVKDGRPGVFYEAVSDPVWSPDGKRLGHTAIENRLQFVVLDGREGTRYDWVGKTVFSADSRHFAHAAAKGTSRLVVTDGVRESPEYEMDLNIDPVAFGPRDNRLAYSVRKNGRWMMVVDGREGPGYDDIAAGSIAFHPNGRDFVYVAAAQGWVVAEDGRQGPVYDEITNCSLVYSDDGRHLVYGARKNKVWFIVLDGQAGPGLDYREIGAPRFSPDGKHIMYTGRKKKKWFVVLDGIAGPAYDRLYRPRLTNEGVEYLAERDVDDSLLRCRLSFTATGAVAGGTVETKLCGLPKEDPAAACIPCRQQKDLLNEDD
jgi:WD40 repeat protein